MGANDAMSIDEIRANIAATRERIVAALADDTDALKLLDRALPADWGNVPIAVVWLLSNAARFATDPDSDGFPAAVAAEWLDRLVHESGEPRERPIPEAAAILLLKWLADVDDALDDDPGAHDAYVRVGARWDRGDYRQRFRDALEPVPTEHRTITTTRTDDGAISVTIDAPGGSGGTAGA